MEWLSQFWDSLTWGRIAFGTILLVLSAIISYSIIVLVIVKLPANYFSSDYSLGFIKGKPLWIRWGAIILKNLIGAFLIGIGVLMILGPGPGLLTILLGLIMIDIPGKRPLEASIIKRPAILSAVNNLRSRYKKTPLIID
ncbi:hypothetical protein BH18ACI1_BH18ACI1_14450 [soil metagenome]|jgi:hypothetical protein|nr:hypothetical protein [Acidobacteriota bacterium]